VPVPCPYVFESVQEIAARLNSSKEFTANFEGDMDKFNTGLTSIAADIIKA